MVIIIEMFGVEILCLKNLLKHFFRIVLQSLGLLWSVGAYPSNSDCAALHAMTGSEGESAVMMFVTFSKLLKRCSVIRNFARSWMLVPLQP